MEMKAFRRIFAQPVPVYSVKGALGHTMAVAGLNQMMVAAAAGKNLLTPATVNTKLIDNEALGWVAVKARAQKPGPSLAVNSGFGGVNCALVLEAE